MNRIIASLFLLFAIIPVASSQDNRAIVTSCVLDEYNLSANVEGQKVYDHDGDLCALIIVRTAAKGLLFEGGMVGVIDTKYKSGEYWVYVPRGMKRIKIKGDGLEVSEYDFQIPIEGARTYIMTLTVPSKNKSYDTSHQATVLFHIKPENTTVSMGSAPYDVQGNLFRHKFYYGEYDVEVSAPRYRTERFSITVNKDIERVIELIPAYGFVTFTGIPADATAYLDGKKEALSNGKIRELDSGEHKLVVTRPMYLDYSVLFTVSDAESKTISVSMIANYKDATISVPLGADIYLDGNKMGSSEVITKLEYGKHKIEARKDRYQSSVLFLDFNKNSSANIELVAPFPEFAELMINGIQKTDELYINDEKVNYGSGLKLGEGEYSIRIDRPSHSCYTEKRTLHNGEVITISPVHNPIYGSLSVVTSKPGASIFLDGLPVGLSPAHLSNILIGDHVLEIKKEGCNDISTSITINENDLLRVEKELTSIFTVTFVEPKGSLFIDGEYVPNSSKGKDIMVSLPVGKHKVRIQRSDPKYYRDRVATLNVTRDVMFYDKTPRKEYRLFIIMALAYLAPD